MEKENWKYCIDIQFSELTNYPSGAKIYCNEFKIAAERMITFGNLHKLYDSSTADLIKDRVIQEMKLFDIIDGSIEMERKMKTTSIDGHPQGLYYHFPKGINDFEKKSGFDFSVFKGYDRRASLLQTSYLDSSSLTYKDMLAQEAMMVQLRKERQELSYYSATISRLQFASSFPNNMRVQKIPFTEIFLDRDANVVLKILLESDFNELDTAVAWEQNLTRAIVNATMEFNGHNLAILQSYRTNFHQHIITEPGIYLEFSSVNNERPTLEFLNCVTPIGILGQIFQIGHYDSHRIAVQKIPELLKFLGQEKVCDNKNQKAVILKASQKKMQQKPKGRSPRM